MVKRGQLISTPQKISKELGLSVQQVKTAIKKLKQTNEITTKGTNKFTIYTITNYDRYQDSSNENKQQKNDQPNIEQRANNQQVTTAKEDKEVKNTTSITNPEIKEGEKSNSENYHSVLNCWKKERDKVGLSTEFIGKNSKTGALEIAAAIDKAETTLTDVRKAIQNLLADSEKRDKYSLLGLANNFELWLNRSQTQNVKTIQLNKTKDIVYYFGVCEQCGYSMTGFNEGLTTCQKCNNQIELRKENNGS